MTNTRRKNSGGYALIFLGAIAITLVPLVGLAIDCSILYIVKARLSAACDAAALAAARNLNLGQTMSAQETEARTRAASFYAANFANPYLGSTRNAPVINIPTTTANNVLTITVSGSATFRPYFMGMLPRFGNGSVTVAATGTASRRDVNMMLVLDKSSSLNTSSSCDDMRTSAAAFVEKFVDGRDTVGLITFGTNYALAFPPARNFKSASSNIVSKINQITCDDNTAMTTAYWQGYQQVIGRNLPAALNTIVLFTDGIPNGIYANFPVKTINDTRFGYSGGACTNTAATCTVPASACGTPATALTGVLAQWDDNRATGKTAGLFQHQATSVTNDTPVLVSRSGCAYPANAERVRGDIAYIPEMDVYGNRIRGYANQYKQFIAGTSSTTSLTTGGDHAPGYPSFIRVDRPSTIGKASTNQMDHAAQRVRARESNPNGINVVTFVIGLGDYALPVQQQPDDVLLRRVANDPASPIYQHNPLVPDGMYIRAENATQMAEAFQRIASEVLRLSR